MAGLGGAQGVVLRDGLLEEGVPQNAAPEDGYAPHPAPAGGVDIRVPMADVDRVLPRHWYRQEDRIEAFGIRLGVSTLPRADRRKPAPIYPEARSR